MKHRPNLITACVIVIFMTCHCVDEAKAADCNRPAPEPITHIELPGNPFEPIPTNDGCWIFASLAVYGLRDENFVLVVWAINGVLSSEFRVLSKPRLTQCFLWLSDDVVRQ
jgi:hypothetical protein